MCVVSMISDYGRRHIWPQYIPIVPDCPTCPHPPVSPYVPPINPQQELEKYKKFQELLDKAAELDKAANQPDCPDPEKTAWLEQLDKRMKRLEEMFDLQEKK